jgi:uncharacterized protein (DUF1501 family)
MMQRRHFLQASLQATAALSFASLAHLPKAFAQAAAKRVLILVELKGGNDGLNTVVPYADPAYAQLRPKLALPANELNKLDERTALHKELAALMPLWSKGELAVVQGVGYPEPNLSHFRSIEIWETASKPQEYLEQGWLARAFNGPLKAQSAQWLADGVVVGGTQAGALAGSRAITLSSPEAFVNQSRLAVPSSMQANATLAHILKVEADIQGAAEGLRGPKYAFKTEFPKNGFGNAVNAAAQVLATSVTQSRQQNKQVPVLHLQLGSFDTHQNQLNAQANLLKQFAEGMAALKSALEELKLWDSTLVMTYAEFGRRPKENQSGGTDHGTAAPHFVMGGAVKGGLYGAQPSLNDLDGTGNMKFSTDYRQLYSTVLQQWWGVNGNAAQGVLGAAYQPLNLLRA